MNNFYRRNLPHIQPYGGEFFCTFRLANTLSKEMLEGYRQRVLEDDQHKISLKELDNLLDRLSSGNYWLNNDEVAQVVANKIHQLDADKYELRCYCIMPNHVHLLLKLFTQDEYGFKESEYPLTKVLKLIKGGSAYEANKILDRSGQFWKHESCDHLLRSHKDRNPIIRYILQNPVKAELTNNWEDWPCTFCKDKYLPNR